MKKLLFFGLPILIILVLLQPGRGYAQTVAQLQNLINALLAQVAQLQAQLNTVRSSAATSTIVLTVAKTGTGLGTVTGQGINCGADCSENYQPNTTVVLTAAANNSIFGGWSGCGVNSSGTICTVQMTSNKSVTAAFNTNSPPSISNITGPTGLLLNAAGTWNVTVIDSDSNLNILLVDWGDGASDSAGVSGGAFTRYFAHKYDTEGAKTINFTVLDKAGGSYSRSVSVMVRQPVRETALGLAGSLFQAIQDQINQITLKLVEILNEVFKAKGLR